MWLKLDDEKTSLHTEEEVKRTAGGADGPIAYVCIYGAPLCPFSSFFFLFYHACLSAWCVLVVEGLS